MEVINNDTSDYASYIQIYSIKNSPKNKMRFNFPRTYPSEDILNYTDNRSDYEKLRDIMCVWHQLIPEPLLELYNGIVERELSRHLQLKSGIPITKSVIDKEIKNFRISKQEHEQTWK